MPLRDHFRPPVGDRLPWPSLHNGWIGEIAARLNDHMPPGYVALDRVFVQGGAEIDVASLEGDPVDPGTNTNPGGTAVAAATALYTPPPVTATGEFAFPGVSEVRVYTAQGERTLVGAVELVSPGNKDRGAKREAFVGKCLDYLGRGVSLVIVDAVTDRRANLHNDIVGRIGAPALAELPDDSFLYAAAYRPVTRKARIEIDIWVNRLAVGEALPTMPLRLVADYFVPVELELTYTEACRRRKLV